MQMESNCSPVHNCSPLVLRSLNVIFLINWHGEQLHFTTCLHRKTIAKMGWWQNVVASEKLQRASESKPEGSSSGP